VLFNKNLLAIVPGPYLLSPSRSHIANLSLPILQQVIPAVFLGSQPLSLDQLPHPPRRNAQDLSGLFRSDQAHLTKVVRTVGGSINRIQIAKRQLLLIQIDPGLQLCYQAASTSRRERGGYKL
jgi:hypothetical protein